MQSISRILLTIFLLLTLIQLTNSQIYLIKHKKQHHGHHQNSEALSNEDSDTQNYDRSQHNEQRTVDTSKKYCVVYTMQGECISKKHCKWEVDKWNVGRCTHKICEDWRFEDQCDAHQKECMGCKADELKCFWDPQYISKEVQQEMKLNQEKLPPVCHTIPNCVQLKTEEECKKGNALKFCVYRFQRNQCHQIEINPQRKNPPAQRYPGS